MQQYSKKQKLELFVNPWQGYTVGDSVVNYRNSLTTNTQAFNAIVLSTLITNPYNTPMAVHANSIMQHLHSYQSASGAIGGMVGIPANKKVKCTYADSYGPATGIIAGTGIVNYSRLAGSYQDSFTETSYFGGETLSMQPGSKITLGLEAILDPGATLQIDLRMITGRCYIDTMPLGTPFQDMLFAQTNYKTQVLT